MRALHHAGKTCFKEPRRTVPLLSDGEVGKCGDTGEERKWAVEIKDIREAAEDRPMRRETERGGGK